jgi:hypothetical protein
MMMSAVITLWELQAHKVAATIRVCIIMEEPTATIFAMLFHSHLTSLENMLLTQLLGIDMKVIEHMDSLQERPLTSHNT